MVSLIFYFEGISPCSWVSAVIIYSKWDSTGVSSASEVFTRMRFKNLLLTSDVFDSCVIDSTKNPVMSPLTMRYYKVVHEIIIDWLIDWFRLYAAGHEMASHSVSHRLPQSNWTRASYQQWLDEIAGQRDNLVSALQPLASSHQREGNNMSPSNFWAETPKSGFKSGEMVTWNYCFEWWLGITKLLQRLGKQSTF